MIGFSSRLDNRPSSAYRFYAALRFSLTCFNRARCAIDILRFVSSVTPECFRLSNVDAAHQSPLP